MDQLKEFERLCLLHHELLWNKYDAAAANKVYKKTERLAVRMFHEGTLQQLEQLFTHDHYNVRLLSAAHSLLKNEQNAVAALESLFEDADPHYSRDAMRTLMAWQQGKTRDYYEGLFGDK